MADNTRVNEFQEKLLQAMDIINAHALSSISFDQTILCTIEDDTYKEEGKYTVTDGSKVFTAYSSDTKLRKKDSVYVTIPQGNFENQKMIIGKKTDETSQPFVFTTPFETIFDMTDNVVLGKVYSGGLVANALNKYGGTDFEYKTLYDEACSYYGYSRLGLKANFKSWIKSAIKGNYGLAIILTVNEPSTASSGQMEEQEYYYTFSNKDMYGNTYDFETDYEQQLVIPLEEIKGTITNIKINFYQEANFYDKHNKPIPCSINGFKINANDPSSYEKDEDGNYVLNDGDTILESNIFVNNIYLCFGYDLSIFKNDMVEVYTQNSITYKHSTSAVNDGSMQNRKTIKVRWVHVDDGTPVNMVAAAENETPEVPYEVRWYRYRVGAAAADTYAGVYWTRIENVSGFSYDFDPDINLQQEKIKVIIIYNSITPYYSNELKFENEQDLPPSKEAQHIVNALTIKADDDTNGNYMIYGQDGSLKGTQFGKTVRSLSAWFDADNSGILEDNEQINSNQATNLTWTFPATNTMIELQDSERTEVTQGVGDDKRVVAYQVHTHSPWYKIKSYYSPEKTNNTVTCEYVLNNRTYTTEKEFTFGVAGTMGTDQTLVIDFDGDTNAVNISDTGEENVVIKVQLYNNQNTEVDILDGSVEWKWYYNGDLDASDVKIENESNSQIVFKKSDFKMDKLYIIQCTVGSLTTYFSIPIKNGEYSFITGPTQVIYQSNGEPSYSREPYNLYLSNDRVYEVISWKIIHNISTTDDKEKEAQLRYIGTLNPATNKLQPLSIYTKDAPIYGVQACDSEGNPLWTQPILVIQNLWPNGVINKWDGKSLVLDEKNSTIVAAAIAAGKKNSDNTFSGVMIGDWQEKNTEESISKQTGVYGFHHGAMSYAFKEDGTAFLGKDGNGRINFDGNNARIYSSYYYEPESARGMLIDLGVKERAPQISMKNIYGNNIDIGFVDYTTDKNTPKTLYPYLHLKSGEVSKGEYPFAIGSKFKVDWDGTIYATGGEFTGTISASTLKGDDSEDGELKLDGFFTIEDGKGRLEGYVGQIDSHLPDAIESNKFGVGMSTTYFPPEVGASPEICGVIKATASNAGLSYNNNYITVQKDGATMSHSSGCQFNVTETQVLMSYDYNLTAGGYLLIKAPEINDTSNGALGTRPVLYTNIPASNQFGIYARFA